MPEINGEMVDMAAAANLMDDEIREQLHAQGIDNDQDFLDAYCDAHYAKYGEHFAVN